MGSSTRQTMKLFKQPGYRARFVYAKLPYRLTLQLGNGVATGAANTFRLRGARDPDYTNVPGDYPDGWQSLSAAVNGYYKQYRTLAASVSVVWRITSTQTATTQSTTQIVGMCWGNESFLAQALPTTEVECKQFAQNCPRVNNTGIKWRFNQRSTNGVSASPTPARLKQRKFFNLRKMDRSHTPYGNVFGSNLVPLTNGRIGRAAGQTAWCQDTPPGAAYPTDEIYLTLWAAAQTSNNNTLFPLPYVTADIEINYYVMFFDPLFQNQGDP